MRTIERLARYINSINSIGQTNIDIAFTMIDWLCDEIDRLERMVDEKTAPILVNNTITK